MTRNLLSAGLLLALSSFANAQYGGPPGSGNGNPYSGGDNGGSDSNNPFSNGSFGGPEEFLSQRTKMVTAHAVIATVAFGFLFPSGSILIRLGSFRGLWLVHGLFQLFAYLFYIAAAAIGIWMAMHANLIHNAHPIIGIFLLILLFVQPFLGFIHHFAFKKHNRRVFWSYAHLWVGRIAITLGIINGGLGLQLASTVPFGGPPKGAIIGYAVGAGIMWLLYVACAIYGERKRARSLEAAGKQPPPYKYERASDSEENNTRYA